MKKIILIFITSIAFAQNPKTEIASVLDNWHLAAANAKFESYMSAMTNDAIYIGTDATENWTKPQFIAFAKPYFDKGKAWSFTALERHVYVAKDGKTAWFDELLNTQMKICRGSGILIKTNKGWKIQHYVLSVTVPNDNMNEVIKIKTVAEEVLIKKLKP